MAEVKEVRSRTENEVVVERAKDFWTQYNRPILIACAAIILVAGGYLVYQYFYKAPQEKKAVEAMFNAENYYRMDSLQAALRGDGVNQGFLKIIDKYGGTKSANLARFYAGDIYLKQGDFKNAAKYLGDFKTDSKLIQARAYKLLGDAYAEQGKNKDALAAYKKAAHYFEEDEQNSSEYLFMAAYFASRVANDKKEATDLFKELKEKYPRTERGFEADKYLAQLGVYE
ncbi:MAG: tetratricopeptide repeat protein [Bacteroidota bacterium]|nr:tetratricopeptide repeat protein [Flavisolibacter sp.]MDQ3843196.1 tetratricopeptide repeat protein [Bacteroidota bacterium]